MKYNCKICNKEYVSYKSLWNHNSKFHKKMSPKIENNVLSMSPKNIENEYKCNICNKEYKYRQGLWKHNKVCKEVNNEKIDLVLKENVQMKKENLEIKKEMIEYKKELENLKNLLQKSLKIHPKTLQKIILIMA